MIVRIHNDYSFLCFLYPVMWYILFSKKNLIEQIKLLINIDSYNPNDFKIKYICIYIVPDMPHTHIYVCVFYITHICVYVYVCIYIYIYSNLLLILDIQIQDMQL